MRGATPYIFIFAILGIIILMMLRTTEGFSTVQDSAQDRTNPLASQQQPVYNPTAQIGTSGGDSLRAMAKVALNIPNEYGDGQAGLFHVPPMNEVSPRIDDNGSFLGLVEFCKTTGDAAVAAGTNPFDNSTFALHCGMCMPCDGTTPITILTRPDESYLTPTGIVVYDADKERALSNQTTKSYRFPRAIPSLQSAVCPGASLTDDSVVPVLAINAEMYTEMKARCDCRTAQKNNPGDPTACGNCAKCAEDGKEWSYIDKTAGNVYPISLTLFGVGTYSIQIAGSTKEGTLDSSASTMNLGTQNEDTPFILTVSKDNASTSTYNPIVWGYLSSTKMSGATVYFHLDKYILSDHNNAGYKVRTLGSADTSSIAGMKKMISQGNNSSMALNGYVPFTFIHPNQLAYYDCKNSYYKACPTLVGEGAQEVAVAPAPAAPAAAPAAASNLKVSLYQHCTSDPAQRGAEVYFGVGNYTVSSPGFMRDASYIVVPQGLSATLYQNADFTGESIVVGSGRELNYCSLSWTNDNVKSMRIVAV